MILEGRAAAPVAQRRLLEGTTAGIEEGAERRDKRPEPASGAEPAQQMLAIVGNRQDVLAALVGESDHEEDVDGPASVRDRARNRLLDQMIRPRELAVPAPDALVG